MGHQVYAFESPDRFVAGTVGPPGDRTFFLQARGDGRTVILLVRPEASEQQSHEWFNDPRGVSLKATLLPACIQRRRDMEQDEEEKEGGRHDRGDKRRRPRSAEHGEHPLDIRWKVNENDHEKMGQHIADDQRKTNKVEAAGTLTAPEEAEVPGIAGNERR